MSGAAPPDGAASSRDVSAEPVAKGAPDDASGVAASGTSRRRERRARVGRGALPRARAGKRRRAAAQAGPLGEATREGLRRRPGRDAAGGSGRRRRPRPSGRRPPWGRGRPGGSRGRRRRQRRQRRRGRHPRPRGRAPRREGRVLGGAQAARRRPGPGSGRGRPLRRGGVGRAPREGGKGASRMQSRRAWLSSRAAREEARGAATAAAGAARKGAAKAMAASAASAAGPLAGVLAGVLCFVLAALAASQAVSAIFGFWDDAASKASLEGLPPYMTVEMVETALECQEEYGHPAGCTIAQIICESGQGDGLSALAERDPQPLRHQVVAVLPRVPRGLGQELLGDQRGVRRAGRRGHGRLHDVQKPPRLHRVPQPGAAVEPALLRQRHHPRGDRVLRLGPDGGRPQGRGVRDVVGLRGHAQGGDGRVRPEALRRDDPRGVQVGGGLRRRDSGGGGEPAGRPLRVGRLYPRGGPGLLRAHPVVLRAGRDLHPPLLGRTRRPPAGASRCRRRSRATSSGAPATLRSTWAATSTSTSRSPATCAGGLRGSRTSPARSGTDDGTRRHPCRRRTS